MGLFNAIFGDASEIDLQDLEKDFQHVLGGNETMEKAFVLVRDLMVFTNKRLILVDKQGLTGKKKEYLSIPYRSILRFSVESRGHFDMEAELRIWLTAEPEPRLFTFRRDKSILEIQRALATYLP